MNNQYLDRAVAELELHVAAEQAVGSVLTETEHHNIYKTIKRPKVFEKVEYRPCKLIVDNR